MNNNSDPMLSKIRNLLKENWLICTLVLLLGIYLFWFTLNEPYHLDTTGYFNSTNDFQENLNITCGYGTRCMSSYYLLPFSIFGDYSVKIGFVFAGLLFFLFSYLFLRKIFSNKTALISTLLTLLLPASIITITHLKEDFVGMMFFAIALYFITFINSENKRKSIIFSILSPIFMSFALLSKEIFLMLLPFYGLIYLYFFFNLNTEEQINLTNIKNEFKLLKTIFLILQPIILIITLLIIKPDYLASILGLTASPYLGQFAGFFSEYFTFGFSLWILGSGLIIFILELFGLSILFLEKNWNKRILYFIFVLQTIILVFFLCNNTVMTYRNFFVFGFLLLPLAFTSLELLLKKFTKEITIFVFVIITIVLGIYLLNITYSYVDFHSNYNSQKEFFSNLPDNNNNNTIYLAMDDSGLANYFTNKKTLQHPVDANYEQANEFIKNLKEQSKNNTIYMLPDFTGYDSQGQINNLIQMNFNISETKKSWYENYHSMDFGYNLENFKRKLKQPNCSVDYTKGDNYKLKEDFVVTQYTYNINCNGNGQKTSVYTYGDQVLTKLNIVPIYKLTSK